MAEDKISLAILINNENIPTDIFSSTVDNYFGPQMEDFNKSSLVICILSDLTGWIPTETNVATYIKSQWLFMMTFPENENFEFKIVICDIKNWTIIAQEESIGTRDINTYHIESDKALLIRINWDEPSTSSVESLTDLYSMDESFIKSNYECPELFECDNSLQDFIEPTQNLHTIKEDDDSESLNDSLQEMPKNYEKDVMTESDYSLQEKALELENDSLGNSQNNLQIQNENPSTIEEDNDEELSKIIENVTMNEDKNLKPNEKPEMENISNNINIDSSEDNHNDLIKEIEDVDTKTEEDTLSGFDDNTLRNDSNQCNKSLINKTELSDDEKLIEINDGVNVDDSEFNIKTKDTIIETSTLIAQPVNHHHLNEKKAGRLLKIQSLLGVKSELQTMTKVDFENLNKKKIGSSGNSENNFENNRLANITYVNLQGVEVLTMSETPDEENISKLDTYDINNVDAIVCTEEMCLAYINEPITFNNEDRSLNISYETDSAMDLDDKEILLSNNLEPTEKVSTEIKNAELKIGIISDECFDDEYFSPIDQEPIKVELIECIVTDLITPLMEGYRFESNTLYLEKNQNSYTEVSPDNQQMCDEEIDSQVFESSPNYISKNTLNEEPELNKEIVKNAFPIETLENIIISSNYVKNQKCNEKNINENDEDITKRKIGFHENQIYNIAQKDLLELEEKEVLTNDNFQDQDQFIKEVTSNIIKNNDIEISSDNANDVIDIIQPKVEDVVEMFEKLVLKEEEPIKVSKRYKTENESFNILKQKFERENKESDNKFVVSNSTCDFEEHNIYDIGTSDDVKVEKESNIEGIDEQMNITAPIKIVESKFDNNINENKENERFTGATKKIRNDNFNLTNFEQKNQIKEINELGRNFSIKDIKRIVKEKRERLAINDDYKYPDSVTPTKVEHSLSKSPEYNVPFMDDEAFYNESWYEESDDRWTSLERPLVKEQEIALLSAEPTLEMPKHSIEIFRETEDKKPQIVDEFKKKEPKRKGLISLCGCVSGR